MSCSKATSFISDFATVAGTATLAGTLDSAGIAALAADVTAGGIVMPAAGAQEASGVKTFADGFTIPAPAGESYACPLSTVREIVSSAIDAYASAHGL